MGDHTRKVYFDTDVLGSGLDHCYSTEPEGSRSEYFSCKVDTCIKGKLAVQPSAGIRSRKGENISKVIK